MSASYGNGDDDPYNRPSSSAGASSREQRDKFSLLEQQYLSDTARAEQQQQYAYDSMSTILEVDSEGSELSADRSRARESTSAFLAAGKRSSSNREDRSMSPIAMPEGKNFSGALSALAQQVERLSRDTPSTAARRNIEQATAATSSPGPRREESSSSSMSSKRKEDDGDESVSLDDTSVDANSIPVSSVPESPNAQMNEDDEAEEEESAGEERPRSRPMSAAESLMMIAISPMVSPRLRGYPPQKRQPRDYDDSEAEGGALRLVEVSNKSTITSIDFGLMDKMVEKYFVDKLDKGVQSIAFDCEESGDTIELGKSRARRTGGEKASPGKSAAATVTKSVAVGTEKFSRERFSLLPPTKTRSTQTKSNIDNDIGTSETRRFKLSHLDFGSIRRSKAPAQEDSSTQVAAATSSTDNVIISAQADRAAAAGDSNPSDGDSIVAAAPPEQTKREEDRFNIGRKTTPVRSEVKRVQSPTVALVQQDSLTDSSSEATRQSPQPTPTAKPKDKTSTQMVDRRPQEVPSPQRTSNVDESLSIVSRRADHPNVPIEVVNGDGKSSINIKQIGGALIPSLKTELRVIIEFNDSHHKQRSEVTSNAQLVDGKLSKQTQINTSKHVRDANWHPSSAASSPREVYKRLESAGREHSLMFNNGNQQQQQLATSVSPLRAASSMSSLARAANDSSSSSWRQVSKSSVCNEIETDTRRKQREGGDERRRLLEEDNQQLVMSTNARIRHMPDSKSALDLRSRAARRYERMERDPVTKKLVGSGKIVEKTLVQSEAGFDENDLEDNGGNCRPAPHQVAKEVRPPFETRKTQAEQTIPMVRSSSQAELAKPPVAVKSKLEPKKQPEPMKAKQQPSKETNKPISRTLRSARLEIEEESEDRRQITRNGRLVFDDRLNERRYETHQSGGSLPSQAQSQPQAPKQEQIIPTASPSSPAASSPTPMMMMSPSGGILRNAHVSSPVQRQLLKPISLRASPIAQQQKHQSADQTSNLSSDPETMDSGIAPSGAGSSNALNQQRPGSRQAAHQRQQMDEPTSLTFVDDDEEEDYEMNDFVDQLGTEKVDQLKHNKNQSSAHHTASATNRRTRDDRPEFKDILPPPQFRTVVERPAAKPVVVKSAAPEPKPAPQTESTSPNTAQKSNVSKQEARGDTELTTRLTRSRQNLQKTGAQGERRATRTKFEQDIIGPRGADLAVKMQLPVSRSQTSSSDNIGTGCRLKTQVVFESDTDSSMVLDQNRNPASKTQKELFSETKYSAASGRRTHSPLTEMDEPDQVEPPSSTRKKEKNSRGSNHMDYSLRVHRMRGSQIDSKVNTIIKHTRQPLVNLQAS